MSKYHYICVRCNKVFDYKSLYDRHLQRKLQCYRIDNGNNNQIRELELQLKEKDLVIKELKLENEKYKLIVLGNNNTTNSHNNVNVNVFLTPYNEKCIDPNIVTPEYALTGIDGIVDLLERSTLMANGQRNLICTDTSRNVFYRVNENVQWVRDVDAKYIRNEIFPILASLYKRASNIISEKVYSRLNKLVSDDVSLEEKRQELAILICFMEMSSDKLHQQIINKLKSKIEGSHQQINTR